MHQWDEAGTYPRELHEKAYKAGVYGAIWPKEYGGTPPEDFDAFHDFILVDELARCACGGVLWSGLWSFGNSPNLTIDLFDIRYCITTNSKCRL